jgi:hypothetical protein
MSTEIKKPIQLRVIFILNALMMILPFVFYYVFTTNDIRIGNVDPMWMIYTGIAYIASFVVLVASILKRNMLLVRIMFGVNILIAIPVGAYIGMLIAVISIALSFNSKVKAYFAQ